jgi:hypothetical protein
MADTGFDCQNAPNTGVQWTGFASLRSARQPLTPTVSWLDHTSRIMNTIIIKSVPTGDFEEISIHKPD